MTMLRAHRSSSHRLVTLKTPSSVSSSWHGPLKRGEAGVSGSLHKILTQFPRSLAGGFGLFTSRGLFRGRRHMTHVATTGRVGGVVSVLRGAQPRGVWGKTRGVNRSVALSARRRRPFWGLHVLSAPHRRQPPPVRCKLSKASFVCKRNQPVQVPSLEPRRNLGIGV